MACCQESSGTARGCEEEGKGGKLEKGTGGSEMDRESSESQSQ